MTRRRINKREAAALERFTSAMRAQLDANAWKGGWKDDAPHHLLSRVCEELAELVETLRSDAGKADFCFRVAALDLRRAAQMLRTFGAFHEVTADAGDAAHEAADVANMAMMVADVLGGLRATESNSEPHGEQR